MTKDYIKRQFSNFYNEVIKGKFAKSEDVIKKGTLVENHAVYSRPFTNNNTYPPTITVTSDTVVNMECNGNAYMGASFNVRVIPNKTNAITVRFNNISNTSRNVGVLFKPTQKASKYGQIVIANNTTYYDQTFYMSWNDIKDYVTNDNLLEVSVYTLDVITCDVSVESHYLNGEGTLYGKKVIFFGDSITTETYDWSRLFLLITESEKIENLAVVGANLHNFSDTVLDGNPQSNNSHTNTLANQVQKAINNQYEQPDIVIIAIGTNDGINIQQTDIDEAYNADFAELDLTKTAHAFRYCNDKIKELYPKSKVFWCNPIQGVTRSPQTIVSWANNLRTLTAYGSVNNIETNRCGINQAEEISKHSYLQDNLHPNFNGSMLMAKYNASAISRLF